MTIRRGVDWGASVPAPADLVETDDAGAATTLETARRDGRPLPAIGLLRGDLARTMGGGSRARLEGRVVRAEVDVLSVTSPDGAGVAVAHVIARRRWWWGEVCLAMNAQYLGPWDVAPRGHPNDGLVDVLRVDPRMSWRARLAARRRALTGTHLPHPLIARSSARDVELHFRRRLDVYLDGRRAFRTRELHIVVQPDAMTVHV